MLRAGILGMQTSIDVRLLPCMILTTPPPRARALSCLNECLLAPRPNYARGPLPPADNDDDAAPADVALVLRVHVRREALRPRWDEAGLGWAELGVLSYLFRLSCVCFVLFEWHNAVIRLIPVYVFVCSLVLFCLNASCVYCLYGVTVATLDRRGSTTAFKDRRLTLPSPTAVVLVRCPPTPFFFPADDVSVPINTML